MILREKKGEGCDSREINWRHLLRVIAPSKQALLFVSLVSLLNLVLFFCVFHISFFISGAREPKRRGNRRGQTGTCQAGREGARQKSRAQLFSSSCVCGHLSVCVFTSMSESVC